MAVEISWAPEAEETFDQNFNYLLNEWGDKEAEKFVQQTDQVIMRLQFFLNLILLVAKAKNIAKLGSINTWFCFMHITKPKKR